MRRGLTPRILLSVVAVAALGGGSLGLAVAGGHLKFSNAKSSLKKKSPAPLPVAGFTPGDSAQRILTFQNRNTKSITSLRFEMAERPLKKGERVVSAPKGKTTPDGYQWVKACRFVMKKGKRVKRCTTRLAIAPSKLLTDPNGLRSTLESCSEPWTQLPGASPTYICNGRTSVLLAGAKLPAKKVLKGLPRLAPQATLYLRMTITLPETAGNNLQGRTAMLLPTFVVVATAK